MTTTVVQYNAGNTASVLRALERIGEKGEIADSPQALASATRIIFPGVGHASAAMGYLRERGLDRALAETKAPVLGICLGMQLLFERSSEGDTSCLGIIPGTVRRLEKAKKIPHVGWNTVQSLAGDLFSGIEEGAYFYFVHSYCAPVNEQTRGVTDYEGDLFSAAAQRENFFGVQFHPEKSGPVGEQVLRNFLKVS